MEKKIKILVLSDHPLSPSGVGTQTRYMIEAMLKTGKFKFICLGGAVKHNDYRPIKTEEYKDDWIIFPIDGYGDPNTIRSVLRQERPDILWFMTDPRFYEWLWLIENEIRPNIPMVYYHVWDNYPYPYFNKKYYRSNDLVACISKLTYDIVKEVTPDVDSVYLPHSVDTNIFKKDKSQENKDKLLEDESDRFLLFWNNRNARRKQTGSLMYWYNEFLNEVGRDKAMMIMHTDPRDPHGQDLEILIDNFGLDSKQIRISKEKIEADQLAQVYNAADCTINISDAEGFGLATMESLACETPIIVNMTGGLQEQVTDGEEWFGIGLQPTSKAVIGSQEVPYIYEDRLSQEVVVEALKKMYYLWKDNKEEYEEMGKKGRQHVTNNYNFENFASSWEKALLEIYEKHGSWENRKNYKSWEMVEVQ